MDKTILAIDDSPIIRETMQRMLEAAGCRVIMAEDGLDGVARLSECKPDLILTDINMPRMDGLTFIERVRAVPRYDGVPIVVVSTDTDIAQQERAYRAGAQACLGKPARAEQLLGAIDLLCAHHAA